MNRWYDSSSSFKMCQLPRYSLSASTKCGEDNRREEPFIERHGKTKLWRLKQPVKSEPTPTTQYL